MTISWRSLPARLFIAIVIGGLFVARLPGPEAALAASDESTRYYERAQSYLAKGELQSAVIELKNSVRVDPDNAVARYALGVALLQTGDAASAERELKAARDHGFDPAEAHILAGQSIVFLAESPARFLVEPVPLPHTP